MWWQRQSRVTHPPVNDADCIGVDGQGRLCPFPAVATVYVTCEFSHKRYGRLCEQCARDAQAGRAQCNEGDHSVQVVKVVRDR
jgi:hypothetical protein